MTLGFVFVSVAYEEFGQAGFYNMVMFWHAPSWLTVASSPLTGRENFAAVWAGSKMIVWGGTADASTGSTVYADGAMYDPATNSWTSMTTTGAPTGRWASAFSTDGSKLFVWGGAAAGFSDLQDGGIFDPSTNTWTSVTTTGAPANRDSACSVWTGSKWLVWGGSNTPFYNDGGLYDPGGGTWSAIAAPTLAGRQQGACVWTGSKFLEWGGNAGTNAGAFNDGGLYDPGTNTWTYTTTTGAPAARGKFAYAWTGTQLIVWGGFANLSPNTYYNDGAIYTVSTDTWTPITTTGAPSARYAMAYAWTGSRLIVWGGWDGTTMFTDGGIYNPANNTWQPLGATSPLGARYMYIHTGFGNWTSHGLFVWGGYQNATGSLNWGDGALYYP